MTIREIVREYFVPYRGNKSRTVRFAFPLVFILAALLGAATISSTNTSYVRLVANSTTVKAGDDVKIAVYVSAEVPVNAVDLSLNFPPSELRVNSIDKGQSVITLWTEDPHVSGNTVVLRGGTFNRGFLGEHLIATIDATALASGIANFTVTKVTLLAGDGSGTKLAVGTSQTDAAKLYIANSDGTFTESSSTNANVKGSVDVNIITDINGDGKVDLTDVSAFMAAWTSGTPKRYDFNGDGKMNFTDFGIILADSFFGTLGIH